MQLRLCPSCDYPASTEADRCPECGCAVPPEVVVVRGAPARTGLRAPRAFGGAMVSALAAVVCGMGAITGLRWHDGMAQRLSGIEHIGFLALFAGVPALLALWFCVRSLRLVRAGAGEPAYAEPIRVVATKDGLLIEDRLDASRRLLPWQGVDRMSVVRDGGIGRLDVVARGSSSATTLCWLRATAEEAQSIETALESLRNAAARTS